MSEERTAIDDDEEPISAERTVIDNAEQRSSLAWALARTKVAQGEGLKETLLWAVRNGADLPDDPELRAWVVDVLEGKLDPERGRGRPRKKQRGDMIRSAVEAGIAEIYHRWLDMFQRDRELTWLRFEALRLRKEHPDAPFSRRVFDLGKEADRRAYVTALADLGARPCPPKAARGSESARELALDATVLECKLHRGMGELTLSMVARIVTRAKKSE